MSEKTAGEKPSTLEQTIEIVTAYVGNNTTDTGGLVDLIRTVYASLEGMGRIEEPAIEKQQPAVSIKKSITPQYLVCLEDGKKLKMLKRHLQTSYNLSPDEYRAKWNLPSDYPMVAPRAPSSCREWHKECLVGSSCQAASAKPVISAQARKAWARLRR
jgi:predicted transcriptional regulator